MYITIFITKYQSSTIIMQKYYAGIGSRKTPRNILDVMEQVAKTLASRDWCLRSGAAHGADLAFQKGAIQREIYLPWNSFNGFSYDLTGFHDVRNFVNYDDAQKIAMDNHPNWYILSAVVKGLMTRNVYQILGKDLNTLCEVVICWTPDGATTQTSHTTGGTGQALRLAIDRGITIFNLANKKDLDIVTSWIN